MPQFFYNKNSIDDLAIILTFINDYTKNLELDILDIDVPIIKTVVESCKSDFPHKDGIDNASAFKKVSHFLCFFISSRPILKPIAVGPLKDFSLIDNHQNAIIGFELAKKALHKSKIFGKDNKHIVIEKPIKVSRHSYFDIIDALSGVTPATHFKIVSVLLEQLVYKTNPECQYKINS